MLETTCLSAQGKLKRMLKKAACGNTQHSNPRLLMDTDIEAIAAYLRATAVTTLFSCAVTTAWDSTFTLAEYTSG